MSSQLFKGSEIIALAKKDKPQKIVNTQTAKQAASTIRRKYGSISKSAKYYHRGGGDWVKYDPSKDMKSTSRKVLTKMPRNYAKVAHQVDVRGVDTKRAGKGAMSSRKSGRSPKEKFDFQKGKDEFTFQEKFSKSSYYQTVKKWTGGGKERYYVPRNAYEQAGYVTKDKNDVKGYNSGEYRGLYYSATRPGNVSTLKGFIDSVRK